MATASGEDRLETEFNKAFAHLQSPPIDDEPSFGFITIVIGLAFAAAVGIAIAYLAIVLIGTKEVFWVTFAAMALSLGYVWVGGWVNIKVAHKGVPQFFGKRISWFTLPEGYSWILPGPFMDFREVNMEERSLKLNEAMEVLTKNRVRMKMDATIQWKVVDPFTFLSVGESVIQDGILSVLRKDLREEAIIRIDARMDGAGPTPEGEQEPLIESQEVIGQKIHEDMTQVTTKWGIETLRAMVTKVFPADQEMVENYQKKKKEELQRSAETSETEHVIANVQKIANELKVSTSEATVIFQAERQKLKRYSVEGGAGDFTKGAALQHS